MIYLYAQLKFLLMNIFWKWANCGRKSKRKQIIKEKGGEDGKFLPCLIQETIEEFPNLYCIFWSIETIGRRRKISGCLFYHFYEKEGRLWKTKRKKHIQSADFLKRKVVVVIPSRSFVISYVFFIYILLFTLIYPAPGDIPQIHAHFYHFYLWPDLIS